MIIRVLMVMLSMIGFLFWVMGKAIPFMELIGMDFVGVFMMFVPVVICLIQVNRTRTSLQFDPPSGGMQAIVNFIRRDSNVIPLVGNRVYSGESFLDIPRMGLVEDLGKDTVFNWGVRRTRLGLENINYTPDPRYFNLTAELYRLGFDNSDDLWNVLNVSSITDREMKTYYLDYMGRVYQNVIHPPLRGAVRLVDEMKSKRVRRIRFNPGAGKSFLGRLKGNSRYTGGRGYDEPVRVEPVRNYNTSVVREQPVQSYREPYVRDNRRSSVDDDVDRLIRRGGRV